MNQPTRSDPSVPAGDRCPLTAALEVIGGRWTLIALYWLSSGVRGFNELQRLMPRISHKVLTETLRDLEKHGLVTREVRSELPLRVEYSICGHGETVRPVIEAMRAWGHVHIAATPDYSERIEGLQCSGTAAAQPVEGDGAAING